MKVKWLGQKLEITPNSLRRHAKIDCDDYNRHVDALISYLGKKVKRIGNRSAASRKGWRTRRKMKEARKR